jgi:hypothetical protein
MKNHERILTSISECEDAEKLKNWIENARNKGELEVAEAAFRRLISLVPSEKPGTVEHDFWQTIHAFEYTLSQERKKTTRLSRTRQKIARVGVIETLKDWALSSKQTDGFDMLVERGMPELTGEAIVLRHPGQFDIRVRDAAAARLREAGVDLTKLEAALTSR